MYVFLMYKIFIYNTSAQGSLQSGTLIQWRWINQHWSLWGRMCPRPWNEVHHMCKFTCHSALQHLSGPDPAGWDLAPDALRILCLGFYLWCLHMSQLALQRETQTAPAMQSRGQVSWHALCFHADMTVTLMYFGAAKLWHIDPISGFTCVIPRMPTWVNSCSLTPESQYFGLHRDLRIWFYSIVNRKF